VVGTNKEMATSSQAVHQTESSGPNYQDVARKSATLKRARLVSQVFFVVMTFSLWLGVGLPPVWGGTLNGVLLLVGAFSMYKVFTGVRVSV
jgi:hypothetical protein